MDAVITALFLLGVLAVGIWDWRTRRIPNKLNFSLIVLGVLFHALQSDLPNALLGMLMGLVISLHPALILRMSVLQGIGGGDIKFMMALGSFYGPSLPFFYVLGIGSIAAVVGGLVQLIRARQLVTYILLRPFGVPDLEAATVPFGTYLALGVFLYEITTWMVRWL